MKETVDAFEYAGLIGKAVRKGALLNTSAEKFNSMVIGWGHLGTVWGLPTFIVYVRDSRFTKQQLDRTGEFTVSFPLDGADPEISRVCGSLSGRDIDKAEAAHLDLVPGRTVRTQAVRQYPLTLECRVLYSQKQDLSQIPEDILGRFYPGTGDGRDPHTAYIAQIVDAYVIRED